MAKLLHWISHWPLRLVHALGTALGWAVYLASPSYRRRFRAHVAQAGVSRADARMAIASAGRMVAELPRLWLRGADSVPLRSEGDERVQAALDRGKGLVLLTPHLGCFEITAQAYARQHGERHPITVMYRPARQAWLRAISARSRDRRGMSAVPAELKGVRQMLRALKRGDTVGLLPDQVPPEGMGVWAPFFGREAYTMTLAARLVQQSGAALLRHLGRAPAAWRRLRGALPPVRGAAAGRCPGSGRIRRSDQPCDAAADPAFPWPVSVGLPPLQVATRRAGGRCTRILRNAAWAHACC